MPDKSSEQLPRQHPAVRLRGKDRQVNVAEEIKNSFLDYSMSVSFPARCPTRATASNLRNAASFSAMNDLA